MICKKICTLLSKTQSFLHWAPVAHFGSSPIRAMVHTILKNKQSLVRSFSFFPFWMYTRCSHSTRYYHYTFCSSRKCPELVYGLCVKPLPPVGKATTLSLYCHSTYFTQTTVDACALLYGDISAYYYVFVVFLSSFSSEIQHIILLLT